MQVSRQATDTPAPQPYFTYSSPCSSIDRPISVVNLAPATEDAEDADVNYLDEDEQAELQSESSDSSSERSESESLDEGDAFNLCPDDEYTYPNDEETGRLPASTSWPEPKSLPLPVFAAFDDMPAPEDADVKYPSDDSSSEESDSSEESEWQAASSNSSHQCEQSDWETVPNVVAFNGITAAEVADVKDPSDEETGWQSASPYSSSERSEWESVPNDAALNGITTPEVASVNELNDDKAQWQPAYKESPPSSLQQLAKLIEWQSVPDVATFKERMAPARPWPPAPNHVAAYRSTIEEPPTGVYRKHAHYHQQLGLHGGRFSSAYPPSPYGCGRGGGF